MGLKVEGEWSGASEVRRNCRVLVIDDNPDDVELLPAPDSESVGDKTSTRLKLSR